MSEELQNKVYEAVGEECKNATYDAIINEVHDELSKVDKDAMTENNCFLTDEEKINKIMEIFGEAKNRRIFL
jgi:hypothetical protein